MATTKSLNSDDSVYVTTFYGGPEKGRSYDITVKVDNLLVTKTVSEKELVEFVCAGGMARHDGGTPPVFDR